MSAGRGIIVCSVSRACATGEIGFWICSVLVPATFSVGGAIFLGSIFCSTFGTSFFISSVLGQGGTVLFISAGAGASF